MKTLHVNVNNRIAVYSRRNGAVVCGNSDYVIKFSFDAEWEAHPTKTARFIYNGIAIDKVFEGDTVAVPLIRNAELAAVGVFAGDLKTTTPALIPCVKSILCEDGLPPDPEPEVYVQIMEILNAYEDATGRISQLEADVADLKYVPIEVTSFSVTPASAEKGQTLNSVSLMWALNKTPEKITIGSNEPTPTKAGTLALDGQQITKNRDFWIVATDERGTQASKKASVTFYNGVYYGVAEAPATYDSAFIIALGKSGKKVLRSSKLSPFTVTAGAGQYIYYCLPTSMGPCSFKVGGFDGGFDLVATPAYTNEYGHEEAYYIYRSTNAGLGETTVEVK